FERDGTTPRNTVPETIEGVTAVVKTLRTKLPTTKILFLAIFPRGEKPDDPVRKQVNAINVALAKLNDGKNVRYLDIGPKFLAPDGTLPKEIMPDFLHPNEKGYQIWADAIIDRVKQMLQPETGKPLPSFSPPSSDVKVAGVEETIAAGKLEAGVKSLEKLETDKDAKTAEAAKASLAAIEAWKESVDKEIARLKEAGDVFTAAELATGMGATYSGDAAKAYKDQASELKKEPGYATG